MKPTTVSITHCPGHQKDKDSMGNSQAEQVAPGIDIQEPILIMGLQEILTAKWDKIKKQPHLKKD